MNRAASACRPRQAGRAAGPDPAPTARVRTKPPTETAGVQVSASEIRIVVSSGVTLVMPLRDGRLIGITSVTANGVPLRNPLAPPLAPLIQTTPARQYTECVYEKLEKRKTTTAPGEEFVIHSTLRATDGARTAGLDRERTSAAAQPDRGSTDSLRLRVPERPGQAHAPHDGPGPGKSAAPRSGCAWARPGNS